MKIPGALVIGPMKAGTSWIHEYLERRGDVCLPTKVKETFFFERNYGRGLEWYSEFFTHFDPARHKLIVESAPSLFHNSSTAPQHIMSSLGNIPLVVTLRDPKMRAWSHYQHMRRYGYTRAPLPEAVKTYPAILEASLYGAQLAAWGAIFSDIKILWQEELAHSPTAYAARLDEILGLEARDLSEIDLAPVNRAATPTSFHLAKFGRFASQHTIA